VTFWACERCREEQTGRIPDRRLCHACDDAERAQNAFTVVDAGIPERYRRLTRESWQAHFRRPWPAKLASWSGTPPWAAFWGPTGTGKSSLAAILLAEHLRTGRRGRWISGPELARRIRLDFTAAEDVLAPLLVTPLLVLDEPLNGAAADWYTERIVLLTHNRDDRGLATIVTSQILPELLAAPPAIAPPLVLSRWLSGLQIFFDGDDVRLQGEH
jgi:hypothetical protein